MNKNLPTGQPSTTATTTGNKLSDLMKSKAPSGQTPTSSTTTAGTTNLSTLFNGKTSTPKEQVAKVSKPWSQLTDSEKSFYISQEDTVEGAENLYNALNGIDEEGGFNRDAEATDNYILENIEEKTAWFKQRFPDFPIHTIQGLVGGKWGKLFEGSKVLISDLAGEGTIHHEAFHVFSQLFLTENELTGLYLEARSRTGQKDLTDRQVEEILAEEFRTYMLSPEGYVFSKSEPVKQSAFTRFLNWLLQTLGITKKEQYKIESAFHNLSKGTYYLQDAKRTSRDTFDRIAELSERDTYMFVRDINYQFFKALFSSSISDEALFNLEGSMNEIYSLLNFWYKREVWDGRDDKGSYQRIIDNWEALKVEHTRFVKQYKIDIDKATLVVEGTILDEDHATGKKTSNIESIEVNIKDIIPPPIRILIAGLPSVMYTNDGIKESLTEYGTRSTVMFNRFLNILNDQLSNLGTVDEMFDKIRILSNTYPEMIKLLERLQVGNSNINEKIFELRNSFFKAFAHNKNNPLIMMEQPNGERYFMNASVDNFSKVMKNQWKNNAQNAAHNKAKNSAFKLDADNQIQFKTEAFLIAFKQLQQLEANTVEYRDKIFSILSALGMEVAPEARFVMNTESLQNYVTRLSDTIRALPKEQQANIYLDAFYNEGGLPINKELDALVNYSSKFFYNDTDLMYYNQEGNPEYVIALNSHISNTVNALNSITEEDGIISIPDNVKHLQPYNGNIGNLFATNSRWWESLLNGLKIELSTLKGYTDTRGTGKDIQSSNPGDIKRISFNAILDGWVPFLRAAERKIEFAFKIGETKKNVTNTQFKQMMVSYLKDELLTSFAYFQDPENFGNNLLNYKDNIKNLRAFSFIYEKAYKTAGLRNTPLPLEEFFERNVDGELKDVHNIDELNRLVDLYISKYANSLDKTLDKFITKTLNNTLLSLLEDNVVYNHEGSYATPGISPSTLMKYGIDTVNNARLVSLPELMGLIRDAMYSNYIGTTEQLKLFVGDLALYKDKTDFHKRTTGAASTKYNTINDNFTNQKLTELYPRLDNRERNGTFSKVVVDDIYVSNNDLKILHEKYSKVNITDAQSWSTLDEYRDLMLRNGAWGDKEKTYQWEMQKLVLRLLQLQKDGVDLPFKVDESLFTDGIFSKHTNGTIPTTPMYKGKELSIQELPILPIIKPQGFGHISNVKGLFATQMFKTSTAPIFMEALDSNSAMFRHILTMMSKGQSILTFPTAEKSTILLQKGKIQDLSKTKEFISQDMRYEDFGIQLDVHDEESGVVSVSTQRNSLEYLNLFEFGEPNEVGKKLLESNKEFKKLISNIIKLKRGALIKSLGLSINPATGRYFLVDNDAKTKFKDKLLKIFEARLLPRNVSDAVELALEQERPFFDLVANSNKIDEILLSLVTNSVIARKVKGEMLIQESSLLYDNLEEVNNNNPLLKFYREEGGKILSMQVMISLPVKWVPWVEKLGGLDKFNELIASKDTSLLGANFHKMLHIPSNRIPSQALSSLESMQVVKFLPHYHGAKVVLPSGITVKSGSDFDVDKLTSYFDSYDLTEDMGQPIYKEYTSNTTDVDAIQNRLNEIINDALLTPERFKELTRPNTSDHLKDLSTKSKKSRTLTTLEKESENATLADVTSWWYNQQKAYEFWNSKAGVALAAVQNVAHALTQQHPYMVSPSLQLFFKGFESEEGYRTGGIIDSDNRNISDNTAEFLTAFVDAVKDPFIFELVDTFTFKAFVALNRLSPALKNKSVGVDTIAALFSQDIIKDYLRIKRANQSSHMFENQYSNRKYKGTFSTAKTFADKNTFFYNDVLKYQEAWYEEAVNNIATSLGMKQADINKIPKGSIPLTYEESLTSTISKLKGESLESEIIKLKAALDAKQTAYKYSYFTKTQLNSNEVRKNFKAQVQVLDNFLSYMELGSAIDNTNRFLRKDARSAMPQHLITLVSKLELPKGNENLIRNQEINAVEQESMLNDHRETYQEALDMYSWTSTIFEDPKLNEFFKKQIIPYLSGIIKNQRELDKAINTAKSHLFVFLSMATLGNNVSALQGVYKSLFTSNNSIARQLLEFQKAGFNSEMFKELQPILNQKIHRSKSISPIDNISTFSKRYDVHESDMLEADIFNQATEGTPRMQEFIPNMIIHSFLQSGLLNSPISYFNFMPNRIFMNFGNKVLDTFRDVDDSTKDDLLDNFLEEFFMNQAHNSNVVPRMRGFAGRNKVGYPDVFKDKKNRYANVDYVSQNYYMDNPGKYYDSGQKPPIGIVLYKRISEEEFGVVAKLGDGLRFIEYYPVVSKNDLNKPLSILSSNIYTTPDFSSYAQYDFTPKDTNAPLQGFGIVDYRSGETVTEDDFEDSNTPLQPGNTINNRVEEFRGFWRRNEVSRQTNKVFLFGDNTNDRLKTKYVPSSTQAVIRGLPNAIGIDTKKDRGTNSSSYLSDNDFNWFKAHVDNQIQQAINSGKIIVIPKDGIGTGKAMLKEKAPRLFEYLQDRLDELKNSSTISQPKASISDINTQIASIKKSDKRRYSMVVPESKKSIVFGDNAYENSGMVKQNSLRYINVILRMIENNSKNGEFVTLAKLLRDKLKVPIQIQFLDSAEIGIENAVGAFTPKQEYGTSLAEVANGLTTEEFERTVLHEGLHALLSHGYATDAIFKAELDTILDIVKRISPDLIDEYGLFSSDELFAHAMTDPDFNTILANLKEEVKKKGLLTRIYDSIMKFLNRVFGGNSIMDEENLLMRVLNLSSAKIENEGEELSFKDLTDEQFAVLNKKNNRIVNQEGVDFVFEQTPELSKIGTELQYSSYLNTVFPDSKVKDIVYHRSNKPIENFTKQDLGKGHGSPSEGIYFSPEKNYYPDMFGNNVASTLINLKKPFIWDVGQVQREELLEKNIPIASNTKGYDGQSFQSGTGQQYTVFETDQIHILGSKQDIEGFKEFVRTQSQSTPNAIPYFINSLPSAIKDINTKELNKESTIDGLDAQYLMNNFDTIFPELSYLGTIEKNAYVNGIMNGDVELICGI